MADEGNNEVQPEDLDEEEPFEEDGQQSVDDNVEAVCARIEARCEAVGYETERRYIREDEPLLRIQFPNGRSTRRISLYPRYLRLLDRLPFENVRFLGDYEAIVDISTGDIEASVGRLTRQAGTLTRFWQLEGAEILDDSGSYSDGTPLRSRFDRPRNWRLRVQREDVSVELSPSTDMLGVLLRNLPSMERFGRAESLKIRGVSTSNEHEALDALENLGAAFLFDLDVVTGTALGLTQAREPIAARRQGTSTQGVAFPGNRYVAEPLALYTYGRSAAALPLLEYLAYYQSIEFFFPAYANAEVLHRVGNILRDPSFRPSDELSLARLVSTAVSGSRGASEREQLRLAVRASVEPNDLRSLVLADDRFTEHFCSKKQSIGGVKPLQLDGSTVDLRDQVADRIYAIRCRVVHTKQDGGEATVDLLLPSSREARSLEPDIALVRLVARRVLIERASAQ